MSAKEILLEVAEQLPPDATLVDAIYELEFRQAVADGVASLDRGERVSLEEARKRIPQLPSGLCVSLPKNLRLAATCATQERHDRGLE